MLVLVERERESGGVLGYSLSYVGSCVGINVSYVSHVILMGRRAGGRLEEGSEGRCGARHWRLWNIDWLAGAGWGKYSKE